MGSKDCTPLYTFLILLIIKIQLSVANPDDTCRSKTGLFRKMEFNEHACAWCYYFLFPDFPLRPVSPSSNALIVKNNLTIFTVGTVLVADSENATLHSAICSTLSQDECERWRLCCQAARDCCQRQLSARDRDISNSSCAPTWDGYGCWDEAKPNTNSYLSCPTFLTHSFPTRTALKVCTADGTWLRKGRNEWTDYTPCLKIEELKVTIYVGIGCQIASILLLVPALAVFLQYQSLRRQHRIRLHINFFLSFILNGICIIIWNIIVTYDKLSNPDVTDTLLYQNGVGCRILSFLKLYFTSTNYAWMFCEGLYLYRLLANTFSPPKHLLPFYIGGWGVPLIYCVTYAVVRYFYGNSSCWAVSLGPLDWIMYTPNLTCLVVNIFFLCNILRILLTQLQSHPNEPSNFRKALKAAFVLVPLFGVQLVVTVYRLSPTVEGAVYYERFTECVFNTQGFFVAIIFCFCNGEVASQIKRRQRRFGWDRTSDSRKLNSTFQTNFSHSTTQQFDMDGGQNGETRTGEHRETPREGQYTRLSQSRF